MTDINMALLPDFIVEAAEHLDEVETLLVQLGNEPDNLEILNDVFRPVHNIKGGSQFACLDKISVIAHRLEDLLDLLRNGSMTSSVEIVDLMIETRDRIALIVTELEQSQQEISDVDDLVEKLTVCIESGAVDQSTTDQSSTATSNSSSSATALDNMADTSTIIGYDEEHDEELFGIFVNHQREKLLKLEQQTKAIDASVDIVQDLQLCVVDIKQLWMASNYMGYTDLADLYQLWGNAVNQARAFAEQGEDVELDFMDDYFDLVRSMLPQSTGVSDHSEAEDVELESTDDITASVLAAFGESEAVDSEDDDEVPVSEAPASEPPGANTALVSEEDLEINLTLLPDFILESREHLDEMESIFLQLSDNPSDLDLLNDVFRPTHNIKGGAQFTCLSKISRLAHRLEDLLDLLRQGTKASNSTMIDLFIDTRDRIVQLVNELEDSQAEVSQIDDLVSQLTAYIDSDDVIASQPQSVNETAVAESPADDVSLSTYDEEDDQELFDIFVSHLGEQLQRIAKQCAMQAGAADPEENLQVCDTLLAHLWSAANYMGYADLTLIYDNWRDELKDAIESTRQGQSPQLNFMADYQARIGRIFPQIDTLESSVAGSDPSTSNATKTLAVKKVDTTTPTVNAAMPSVSEKLGQAFSSASSNDLFARLNHALDSNAKQISNSEYDALNQVYDEMVSPDQSFNKAKAAAQKSMTSANVEIENTSSASNANKVSEGGKKIKKSMRVDADKIDSLMNQVGELVVDRSYFFQLFGELRDMQKMLRDTIGVDKKELKTFRTFSYKLGEAIASLGRTSNELQEGVMKMRMLPISQIFNRYPRLVRDLTHNSEKKVNLLIRGGDTELDKMIVEELSDPLIHIIRNAVDHGIETRDDRLRIGKPEFGTLELEAYQESNHIVIEVLDDGRGIDPDKVRRKLIDKGLYSEEDLERYTDKEVANLILTAGFSTAEKITGTSGRGVGMDIVKKNVEKLNGILEINSKPGHSTQMRMKIPLTLAIIHALMIRVGDDLFTIPLANVDETVRIHKNETSVIEGVEVIYLRGDALPIFRMSSLFNIEGDRDSDKSFVVIVSTEGQRTGFIVDELIGQDEVVIKPLADYVQEKSGFSGATIVGDGRISLILDVYELVKMTASKQAKKQRNQTADLKSRMRRRPDQQQAAG